MHMAKILLRKSLYFLSYYIDKLVNHRGRKIFILCYHSLGEDDWFYNVRPEDFKSQMNYLLTHYNPISLSDLYNFLEGENTLDKDSFVVTFDDGYRDILSVKDFCSKNQIKPTVFVLSQPGKANRDELETPRQFLRNADILKLYKAGWEIGSHGSTHNYFGTLDKNHLLSEIVQSKYHLEKALKIPINFFAYPKGVYNTGIINIVKTAEYKLGLSMDNNVIKPGVNRFLLPRVGVNRSHSLQEFRSIFLSTSAKMRNIITMIFGVVKYN